jgi:hypothetical protein
MPTIVAKLIERFEMNQAAYRAGQYNEAQVRQEFINPFWDTLGWDVYNRQGYSEKYKEVVHEDALKIQGKSKAPDYAFCLGGRRVFFVEAKKPAVKIKEDVSPAYQLRRYAWSAKLPLSVLTDFEEFAVYDCRVKPVKTDKAAKARVMYVTYKDYPARWDEIAGLFSPEAIRKGAFDRYVTSKKAKRGTAEVDAAFLQEIEGWRDALARNIALRNPGLSVRELNRAVQMTIDRLIFLRICEDRGIEPYGRLGDEARGGAGIYQRLGYLFRQADDRYNSGLFHFRSEKGRDEADDFSLNLQIDDRVLKEILDCLYYPECPYEFSVLPSDILGQVYEQFLGKVIRLTPAGRAKVEEKPEVKKAGGVYYTPTYIVDYIVGHTVGKLLGGRTPRQVWGSRRAAPLRVLDPACGSGTFLLQAYQYLLDWYLEQYVAEDPEMHARQKRVAPTADGHWRLATEERKRILLTHIHGVDIDPQAVEVTKLSLLLKVLEEEEGDVQLSFVQERALPDLGHNVQCGNSLIGPDYYEDGQLALFDEEEMYRINAFDWKLAFPQAMAIGGFDAAIGNPPYVFGRDWKALGISDETKAYLGKNYITSPYQLDMFSIFMEKAFSLCKRGGRIGLIVPDVWLTNMYSSSTRHFVLSTSNDLCLLVPPPGVFPGLTVDTIVYTLEKSTSSDESFQIEVMRDSDFVELGKYQTSKYIDGKRPISTALPPTVSDFVDRLKEQYAPLGSIAKITRGVHPYRRGYGHTAFGTGRQTGRDLEERPYHSKKGGRGYRPFIYGRDLHRFTTPEAKDYVRYGSWLAEPRKPEFFVGERVYSRKILADRLVVTLEATDSVADQQVYITLPKPDTVRAAYLAGILGSWLIAFFIRAYYDETTKAFPQIKVGQLRAIPIRPIDFDDLADVARHDRMVSLVERMLSLHEKLAAAKTPQAKRLLGQQIEITDREIDRLAYALYGLTEKEIVIIEGA